MMATFNLETGDYRPDRHWCSECGCESNHTTAMHDEAEADAPKEL